MAFFLAKRTKRSSLFYAIPLLAGLAVGHAFIPPTPGPVLAATMLGVDLGWVILVRIGCSGYLIFRIKRNACRTGLISVSAAGGLG